MSERQKRQKNRIIFLPVPETLRNQIAEDNAMGFSINPDIPIPIEIPENEENLNLEELSGEMIISGMLRVIAAGPEELQEAAPEAGDWLNYYRHFIVTLRPSIMGEFTEAAILKARNGDLDLALEILDALRGLFPFSPVVKLNRALVLEERAALLEKRGGVESPNTINADGIFAFEAVQTAYEEALALDPPFPDVCFNAGFFYLERKDFCRARECFSQYIELVEDNEKKEQAESIVKEIDKNGLEDISINDAYKLIRQGKEEEGMRNIREFIEAHPAVWNGWFILGWALRRLGRWEDAAAAFNKAVELGGGNSDTHNELAICLMESGDLAGARRKLETALREDPENIKIISNMGVLALRNGNAGEAAGFFRTVLELDPEDPIAKNFFQNE